MIINKNFKEQIKKSKPCSEHILNAFFNLKTATKVLAITSFLMASSAHAWFGLSDAGSTAKNETTKVEEQKNQKTSYDKVPENPIPTLPDQQENQSLKSEGSPFSTDKKLPLTKVEKDPATSSHQNVQKPTEQSPSFQDPVPANILPENYPGKPPAEISNLFREHFEENVPEIDEDHPNYIALQEVKEKMQEIFGTGENKNSPDTFSANGSLPLLGAPKPFLCTTDEPLYRPSRLNAFETNAFLNTFASEPLFLENKEEFSVELRPFFKGGKNPDGNKTLPYNGNQIGIILGLRKQFPLSFVSAELLYGRSFLSIKNTSDEFDDHNVLLGITGGLFRTHVAGSLTFSVGGTFSDMNKREDEKRKSHPKAVVVGSSPLLVFYPPNFPIDFFLGGDLFYVHCFGFEETQKGDKYSCNLDYESSDHFFWRVKAGPSYTFKRSSTKRLYQLVFSFATNVQSAFANRFSFYPSLLFESQGHEKRGGWLLKLGYEFSTDRGAVDLAYGLRF